MSLLEVTDLSVEVAGTPILEGLTLSLRAGDKTGVVGRNGARQDEPAQRDRR